MTKASAGATRVRGGWLGALLMPPLLLLSLLYHALANLQITVGQRETAVVVGIVVGVSMLLGLLAALGGPRLRVLVLAVVAVGWMDMATDLPAAFDALTPDVRHLRARDSARLRDISEIQQALDTHIARTGGLPAPSDYGEATGPATFWPTWWDVSTHDGDGDGEPFLDFLVDAGLMASVPVDPVNEASPDGHPSRGRQYAFLLLPAGYAYAGGACPKHEGKAAYMLGVTDLEGQGQRPFARRGSETCTCLWREQPDFFAQHFDFAVCGYFAPQNR